MNDFDLRKFDLNLLVVLDVLMVERSVTRAAQRVGLSLEEIRDAGFAWTAEELHEGLTSVAAPVRGPSGAVVAALHCHGPSFRFPVPGTEDDVQ